MNTLMSRGLMLAALLSFAVPVKALAQCGCPFQAPVLPPTQCGCPVKEVPVVSQRLVVGPLGCCPQALPQLKISQGANTELHLLNPQSVAVRFNAAELGISYLVPANSERVIYIDQALAANLCPNQTLSYDITSADGCRKLAYGCLKNEATVAALINVNRQCAVREESPAVPQHKEQPVNKHKRVRGFW
ncbi:MAG TPA: hypothetical protein V6C99_09075 [Oculatellaceae cyanobacterium]|jgi:hypothetical protein